MQSAIKADQQARENTLSTKHDCTEKLISKHSEFILNGLEFMQSNRILCDVILIAETKRFDVHKCILAACSDYFRSMFTSGMRESTQREIELKGVSANGLAKCLQIIYKSHTHFDSSTDIFDVIAAANHLQFLLVVDYCEQNLLTMLTCDNFNYFIEMCRYYGLQQALQQIDLFIVENLAKIIQNSCSSHIASARRDCKSIESTRKQSLFNCNKRKKRAFRRRTPSLTNEDSSRTQPEFERTNKRESRLLDDFLAENQVTTSSRHKSLSYEQLLKCLKTDQLRVREIDLFHLTWQWINYNLLTNKRSLVNSKKPPSGNNNKKFKSEVCSSQLNDEDDDVEEEEEEEARDEEEEGESEGSGEQCSDEPRSNRNKRVKKIRCLLKQIRFALITPNDLINKVQSINRLMVNDRHLRQLVLKAFNYHLNPTFQSRISNSSSHLAPSHHLDCLIGLNVNRIDTRTHLEFNMNIRSPIKSVLIIGGREINPYPQLHDNCFILNDHCQIASCAASSNTDSLSSSSPHFSNCFSSTNGQFNSSKSQMVSTNGPQSFAQRRILLTNVPNSLSHMQCVVVQSNFLFVLGGCTSQCAHGESAVNTVHRFDPRLNVWINVSKMLDKRAYFFACHLSVRQSGNGADDPHQSASSSCETMSAEQSGSLHHYIYAIGGKNRDGALASVERFDLETNTWTYCQSLPSTYYAHAGCVLNNKAYISGGYTQGRFTSDLHVYSPETNEWDELRPMHTSRGWHCMCEANGKLYVFGGCYLNSVSNGAVSNPVVQQAPLAATTLSSTSTPTSTNQTQISHVQSSHPTTNPQQAQMAQPVNVTEYYSPETDQWTIVKQSINLHKEATCFKLSNYIYVIGGYNIQAKTGQKCISRYDFFNDHWQTLAQLPNGMTGLGSCLIDLPWYEFQSMSNQNEGTYQRADSIASISRHEQNALKEFNEDEDEEEEDEDDDDEFLSQSEEDDEEEEDESN